MEKSDEAVTAVFTGFDFKVMDDEVPVVNEKLDSSCWLAYIGTCNKIVTGWLVGENEETYIDGLDANETETDAASQPMWAIAVFGGMMMTLNPLWVERYKCDNSLQQFDIWWPWCFELSNASFSFSRGMLDEVDVRFASSSHALCRRHLDPPELPPELAASSLLRGRNVALVAAMNTPTTFCNVNCVQKKYVLNIMKN